MCWQNPYLYLMKRAWIIFLLFLYLIPAIGVAISSHHCDGKITSVSLKLLDIGHKCPCGKRPMKRNCCKDETKIYKIENEQQKAHQFTLTVFKTFNFHPVLVDNFAFSYQQPLILSDYSTADHPPNNLKDQLYVRHRVFRI